ncbi:MAG: cation:proton antiporter [Blastocatellia bacterium]
MTNHHTFTEIATILGIATLTGIVGQKLRQPLIIMFLATGILAGPSGFGIIQGYDQIELLAQIGIALLLFIVGLKLDLHLIRTMGPVALATGLGQIVFTSVIGFGIAIGLGMRPLEAAYVAVALTFSSTIIIVKLLSDKKEIDSLHGQIALGFLIVQDIAAILALVGLTTLGASVSGEATGVRAFVLIALKGLGMLGVVALLMRYLLPSLTQRLAHSPELLTLFAIAWAILLGAGSEQLGFSKEVGAFLAGVSLASTSYRDSIGARLTTLRDFLLLFFFIGLGARLDWSMVGSQIGNSIVFSLFVLIGNPVIVLMIMGAMGYRRRTGFLAGLTVAQISEFSLIVAALGVSIGHLSNETMGLITLVGVVTIFLSTYLILYSYPLYQLCSPVLKIFERRNPYRESSNDDLAQTGAVDVVVVGLGNYGSGLMEHLLRRHHRLLGIDFDPAALERWRQRGVPVLYGDMADPEMHEQLPLRKTRWVVSTVRSREINLAFLDHLQKGGYPGKIALTATNSEEEAEFKKAGAHVVLRPFEDATEQAADALRYAVEFLPEIVDWPVAFLELRVRSDASSAGLTIRELPLSATGISVLAVTRGGRIHYEPTPDFRIFPGDRLLLMGPVESLKEADAILNRPSSPLEAEDTDHFEWAELEIGQRSSLAGKSLAEVRFRERFGATVVGIRRGEDQVTRIQPGLALESGDCLLVIGKGHAIQELSAQVPL